MDVFQRINIMYQVNFAKIEREILIHYLKGLKMIKLSNGVEISEETVISALKKVGISVEPKHIFKAGDVATQGIDPTWRFIIEVNGQLCSVDKCGYVFLAVSQGYFERNDYKFVGRQKDLLKG